MILLIWLKFFGLLPILLGVWKLFGPSRPPQPKKHNVRPCVPKKPVCRKIGQFSKLTNRYINKTVVINLLPILSINTFCCGWFRDPCDLISSFRHMGLFATHGRTLLKVSSITVMNGGDNIGTYIPLFSQAKGAEIAVSVIYYILLDASSHSWLWGRSIFCLWFRVCAGGDEGYGVWRAEIVKLEISLWVHHL